MPGQEESYAVAECRRLYKALREQRKELYQVQDVMDTISERVDTILGALNNILEDDE